MMVSPRIARDVQGKLGAASKRANKQTSKQHEQPNSTAHVRVQAEHHAYYARTLPAHVPVTAEAGRWRPIIAPDTDGAAIVSTGKEPLGRGHASHCGLVARQQRLLQLSPLVDRQIASKCTHNKFALTGGRNSSAKLCDACNSECWHATKAPKTKATELRTSIGG